MILELQQKFIKIGPDNLLIPDGSKPLPELRFTYHQRSIPNDMHLIYLIYSMC